MSRRRISLLTSFLALLLSTQILAGDRSHAAVKVELRYKLVEVFRALPGGGREELTALTLNDRGEVVVAGSLRPTPNNDEFIDGYPRPRNFIWRNGRIVTELVSPDPVLFDVESFDINNRGEVVGSLSRYDPGYLVRAAFIWRNGRFTKIVPPGGPDSYYTATATSINDWGEAGGSALDNDIDVYATPFRWYRGTSTRVPVPTPLSASVSGINNWGQVVGNTRLGPYEPYTGPIGGYVADRKGRVHFLESLPGSDTMVPHAINDRGQIIGSADGRAVLWEDGSVLDLGTLPGATSAEVVAINLFSTIVGTATYPSGDTTAILWKDGRMRDLNELIADGDPTGSNVHLTSTSDINNLGWITAKGTDASAPPNAQSRAYLLVPVWKKRR
jgi:probable HAF family extracellular repeat protein